MFLLCGIISKGVLFGMAWDLTEGVEATAKVAATENIPRKELVNWTADAMLNRKKYV